MNTFLWSCGTLLTLFVTAEALMCNTCSVSILGLCFGEAPVNCSKSQSLCYDGVAKFSSVDLLDIHARGCIESDRCRNQTGSILTVNYNITRTCCHTNLCNSAASVHVTAALSAAALAVWSAWCF